METAVAKLEQIIGQSSDLVFFGGAGVSTESGIPDFRSTDGLYNQEYAYPPETILSHTFLEENRQEFFRFYKDRVIHTDAQPNPAHLALARLETEGLLKAVVTQNIDGLHQKAGSREVIELHGSVYRNYCERCWRPFSLSEVLASEKPLQCACGGYVRPDVVLYEEMLDQETLERAITMISRADTLIVGGTSLRVYPAAGLIDYFCGEELVIINKETPESIPGASLVINGAIGEVLGSLD